VLHTMPSYTERIQEVLPHAKIIRLIGYTNGNKEYQKAKCAAGKWQTTEVLQDEQIHAWIQKGGWIGVRIPEGRIVVDIDDKTEGALLRELLEGERIHHHSITTPNGWQFIFRSETAESRAQGQYQKYVNRLGLVQDTRAAGKGYIVFPTENTEERSLVTQSLQTLDELPSFLYKVWNASKKSSPMAYPYEASGSRDGDFYDMARRLLTCGVNKEVALESLQLAYQYFVPYKKDFP
ncbi:bifunctional DNA primase/polymerase, partial [Escherichia sp. SP-MK2]